MARLIAWPLLLLVVSGCGSVQRERIISSIPVRQGSVEVRYVEITGPAAFVPHTVRFYLCENGRERLLAETELANDGAVLGNHNLELTELANGNRLITLKGQEQADECWVIHTQETEIRMRKL